MLKVLIQVVPHGVGELTEDIAEIHICNNTLSKNRPKFGNYDVIYKGKRFKNIVQEYDRSGGALELLSLTINKLLGETK